MTTIEKIAKAMAANDSGPDGSALFDIHWREFGAGYTQSAIAAVKAMREPSEGMKLAGGLKAEAMMFEGSEEGTGIIFDDMGVVFIAMIDSILTEAEGEGK